MDEPTHCPNCGSPRRAARLWTPPCANAWHAPYYLRVESLQDKESQE